MPDFMRQNRYKDPAVAEPKESRQRRKRDVIIIVAVVAIVAMLSALTVKSLRFSGEMPVSNMVLMFTLININLLLIVLLIFLVFRNLIKLFY
ncbi:MAG: hypothetical protein M0Z56_07300 [Desulfobacteraceae bacterium]|nr:hypothetical protein [Desulfobacteraceae bacterium]